MKKYLFTLLKVLIFLAVVWLIYFFEILFSAKMLQDQQYLVSSLLSYLGLIVLSIPFWTILSTCIFFGFQMSFDKLFSFRIIPIIAAMNAVLLLVFFLVKIPVASYNQSSDFYAVPTVREGYINAFNGMTFFPKKLSSDTIYEGFLFQDAAYFIDSGKINRDTVSFSASRAIGDYSLISKNISISMTTKVKLATMPESGISRWILSQYFEQLKTMKNIFESSFSVGGIFFAILAILLLAVGFYAIVSAISYFLNERQIFYTIHFQSGDCFDHLHFGSESDPFAGGDCETGDESGVRSGNRAFISDDDPAGFDSIRFDSA